MNGTFIVKPRQDTHLKCEKYLWLCLLSTRVSPRTENP